jgi:histidine triad (HIT) family protein
MSDCLFCKIVAKEIPARVAYEDAEILAFDDIHPAAPVHVLVVPKRHIATLNDVAPGDAPLLGRLLEVAARIARERGVDASGWRATFNVGRDANLLVFHLHLHAMGGRPFSWPPG